MEKYSVGCTLDCFDCCKFNVYVDEDKHIKIEGDKAHPYTKGIICKKGIAHLKRQTHKERLYMPLLKVNGSWQEISFEEAMQKVAMELSRCKMQYGTQSVLYYEQYGSGSLLKSIGDIFFNFYGGVSKQKGGPCWSAGMAAQKKNFGDARSHALEDMLNSKTILVWGKNPADTTIHTMQMIQKAKEKGAYVIVIDPICTNTAKLAHKHIQIKPGGDRALALAMGKIIIEEKCYDASYIKQYVQGFEAYKNYVQALDLKYLSQEAGVEEECIRDLVNQYCQKYSTILLGYGLQKYYHGGETIMMINTLSAITGQIGRSGGGVNYANKVYPSVLNLDPYHSEKYANNRVFYVSQLAEFIEKESIQMAVITKSNLLTQLADANRLKIALSKVPFKVCIDQFMTDTAQACDLVIPATTVLESEDLLFSSMTNPYLTYNEKVLEPLHPLMDEYAFYSDLAKRLKMKHYPQVSKAVYLEKVLEPLKVDYPEVNLAYLKDHYFTIHQPVAWAEQKFLTPSGKFEIFIMRSLEQKPKETEYPLRFLTSHSKHTLFSQHFMDETGYAKAYINAKMARLFNVKNQDLIWLESAQGKIQVRLQIEEAIPNDVIMMHAGWWKKNGNPNEITRSGVSDIGGQIAYHETFVKIYA